MTYETLKAGDVRKKGDEVCSKGYSPDMNYTWTRDRHAWRKTELVGNEITACDIMAYEYRRPIK